MKNNKEYDILLNQLIYTKRKINNINLNESSINKTNLKEYFINNVKKSSFLTQILPSILFLAISLISFSLIILKRKYPKFQAQWFTNDLIIPILMFSLFLIILGIILLVQKYILKIKVINLQFIYKKGYHNISQDKFIEILKILS